MKKIPFLIIATLLFAGTSYSQTRVGIAFQASTFGPGATVGVQIVPGVNARVSGYMASGSTSDDVTDDSNDVTVAFDADITLGGVSLLFDWFPFKNAFHLTGGVFYNNIGAEFSGAPISEYKYSDSKTFSADKLGSLSGEFKYPSIAPYVGIGTGNIVTGGRVSFVFDLGIAYVGSPEFILEGQGMIAPTARHAATINKGIESFKYYPFLSLGIGVRL